MRHNHRLWIHSLILGFVEDIGEATLATILSVEMCSHEDSGSTLLSRTLTAETVNLAVIVHLVILEHGQLHLPVLVLDLLGSSVILLLPLLSTSSQSQHKVKSGFLLNVIIRESSSVLQLFTGKDQPLLIWRDSLLILDLSFNILDGITRLHL